MSSQPNGCTAPASMLANDAVLFCTLVLVARNGTVMFTATDTSTEFVELLDNWLCHLQRLHIPPLVWSLDERTHRRLQLREGVHSVYAPTIKVPQRARPSEYKRPSSEEYTLTVALKPQVVLRVLRCGFDAIFLDVDVALIRDPLPWLLRSPTSNLQVSLNYDDRPAQQRVTGLPDLNTGVIFARKDDQTKALIREWSRLTSERYDCPRRPPLWACGDQEQLTRLLKTRCKWRPLSFEAAAGLVGSNDAQNLICGAPFGALRIETLPPFRFASGQSSGLWQRKANGGRSLAPSELLTFHPNFGGFAGGGKKAMLRRVRFNSSSTATEDVASAWCTLRHIVSSIVIVS